MAGLVHHVLHQGHSREPAGRRQQGRKGAAGAAAAPGGVGSAQGVTPGLPPRPDLHRPPVLGRGGAACSQLPRPGSCRTAPVLPRSSARPPRWPRTWLPSPCLPGPPAPPDARPGSWALAPEGGGHPGLRWGEFDPNHSTGSLGQQDPCSVPKHLVSPIGERCRKVGDPSLNPTHCPQPEPSPLSTWPSWRMACRGLRTRSGWACCTACRSCSCPTSSSARAPHSRQASIRPGGEGCQGSRHPRTLGGVSTQAPARALTPGPVCRLPPFPGPPREPADTAWPTYGRQGRWGPGERWRCR